MIAVLRNAPMVRSKQVSNKRTYSWVFAILLLIGMFLAARIVVSVQFHNNHKPGSIDAPSTPRIPIKYCHWMIIAGDSNNRNSFAEWMKRESRRQNVRMLQAVRGPLAYNISGENHKCQARWSDQEQVILEYPSNTNHTSSASHCLIVTSKFNVNQRAVLRLHNDMHNTSYCGSTLDYPTLPDGYQRPAQPDTIWFSHGLWGLPTATKSDTNCTERFQAFVPVFFHWKNTISSFTWQTLFPINSHPAIPNEAVDWDYHCQVETAQQHNLPLADIYQPTQANQKRFVSDYHFFNHDILIHRYLDQCCHSGGELAAKRRFASTIHML